MDRAMTMAMFGGGGKAVTLACMRAGSASASVRLSDSRPSHIQREKVPAFVDIVVEVPKGSFVKRLPDGALDYVAPVPSPFNYGSVPSIPAPDGDPLDAVILGDHLPYGYTGKVRVKGVMKFIDAGLVDDKLICTQLIPGALSTFGREEGETSVEPASEELKMLDLFVITYFFNVYVFFKRSLNIIRGKSGCTTSGGWEQFEP